MGYSPDQPRDDHGRFGEGGGTVDRIEHSKGAIGKSRADGLQRELDAQGVPKDSPIRAVVGHRFDQLAVARDGKGNIAGALAFSRDANGVTLVDFRAMEKGTGVGTALMQHVAQEALTTSGQRISVSGAVPGAIPFYQRMGMEFYAEKSPSGIYSWSSHGTMEPDAVRALADGNPIDKRETKEQGYARYQRAAGNPAFAAAFEEGQHPRDEHGRFTSGDHGAQEPGEVKVPGHTSWGDLPQSQRDAIEAHAKEMGWPSREEMAGRLVDMWNKAPELSTAKITGREISAREAGIGWYATAHDEIEAMPELKGLPDETKFGMVAALSVNDPWENYTTGVKGNEEITGRIADMLTRDPEITITEADAAYWRGEQGNILDYLTGVKYTSRVAPPGFASRMTTDISPYIGTYKLSQLPDDVVGRFANASYRTTLASGPGSTTGWPNVSNAISIWRGESPDDALGGNKLRSFYNDLLTSGRSDSPTIDRWQGRAMTGNPDFKPASLGSPSAYIKNPDWVTNAGSFPYFTSALDMAAARVGATPNDMQAVSWYAVQALAKGKK